MGRGNAIRWGRRFATTSCGDSGSCSCRRRCRRGPHRARGIPIDLCHCPLPKKPRKKAPPAEWEEYWRLQKTMKVSAVGAARLKELRTRVDADPGGEKRSLIVAVDGTFTNRTVFRNLPEKTTVIGRIRKDARLFLPPAPPDTPRRGRRRWYGDALPTPEQIRQDPAIPWITVPAWGSGEVHRFEAKTLSDVRWLGSGNRNVRLVVIRPLSYRPRKGARLLYRDPVYLLCTDPELALGQLLQSFLWRWDIELNFRDEKRCWEWARRRSVPKRQWKPFLASSWRRTLSCCWRLRKSDKDGSDCRCRSGAGWRLESGTRRLASSGRCDPSSGEGPWG